GIKYKPLLCSNLTTAGFDQLGEALSKKAAFFLKVDSENQLALSWWVSPKRTRSYPYGRVYDTLQFSGKKVTVIPIVKDEGKQGDRDFVQWDTISLMSLLGVYVIIGYYSGASRSTRYKHKITAQRFDLEHLSGEIDELMCYQSSALHWNIAQIERIGSIGEKALRAYTDMSKQLNVEMHSLKSAQRRIDVLLEDKAKFMTLSRDLAKKAQVRESVTTQPKEQLTGIKGTLTIKNYLGGCYYWTCDEIELHSNQIFLIEAKHTRKDELPSLGDIKDALLKMMLFTNLENLRVGEKGYLPIPIVKLTTGPDLNLQAQSSQKKNMLIHLREEAETNGFRVSINGEYLTLKTLA
ncbi:MAG: hypothetical protein OXT74_03325, partial [Candidatus Poribacteria bacterium]|nr:hypothetical protein [Candidatus Poribacteria bacterium]